ncbi:hypothetical protein [Catellatospora tritici]|uniref:hypothetical protein n=1 Tax=Catellatospora tritici TaxID=2851566 RepID=UPI001C2CD94F|nr:hypothetical protein [Catellatospora tritici]MBV1853942.1 hypothetical protein [Catellatospora tritici]
MTSLTRASQDACATALRRYRFVAKSRGLLLQPSGSGETSGWLGLNLATWSLPHVLHVNPVVGVRHRSLEAILVSTAGWPAPVASVCRPLGYLTPQNTFLQWDFSATDDLTAVAEDLATAVATYGQPFIDKWSDWDAFSRDVADSGLLLDHDRHLVLPAVAAVNGDCEQADHLIRQELDRTAGGQDAYSKGYRDFAQRFRQTVLAH